jgi:hypothetical protein
LGGTIERPRQYFKIYSELYLALADWALAFYPGEAMRAATTNVTKNIATVAAKKPAR